MHIHTKQYGAQRVVGDLDKVLPFCDLMLSVILQLWVPLKLTFPFPNLSVVFFLFLHMLILTL